MYQTLLQMSIVLYKYNIDNHYIIAYNRYKLFFKQLHMPDKEKNKYSKDLSVSICVSIPSSTFKALKKEVEEYDTNKSKVVNNALIRHLHL